jgi:RNA polymerase sigma-70 factor (ECF subfamily)
MAAIRQIQEVIYRQHYKFLFNICYRIIGNKMDAENVMQECFMKIFDNLNKLKDKNKFIAWIKSIAVNKSIDFVRKKKIVFEDIDENIEEIDEYETLMPYASNEEMNENITVERICKAIQELPDGYRTILSLHLFEDYSFDEIAKMLKIKQVSVRTQYSRGRKKVLEKLRDEN